MAPVPEQASTTTSLPVPMKTFNCARTWCKGHELGCAVMQVRGGHGKLRGWKQRA